MDLSSRYASGPKRIQALQIQKVHPGPHSNACNFYQFFIPVLSRLFFTFRTPKQRPEDRSILLLSMVQAP